MLFSCKSEYKVIITLLWVSQCRFPPPQLLHLGSSSMSPCISTLPSSTGEVVSTPVVILKKIQVWLNQVDASAVQFLCHKDHLYLAFAEASSSV